MTKFEEKVKSMTTKEIILNMIESLKNPTTKLDMESFGYVHRETQQCYGCIATNLICRIGGYTVKDLIANSPDFPKIKPRNLYLNTQSLINYIPNTEHEIYDKFIVYFESAIDLLRRGLIKDCNNYFSEISLNTIKNYESLELPVLTENFTDKQLNQYITLANLQE